MYTNAAFRDLSEAHKVLLAQTVEAVFFSIDKMEKPLPSISLSTNRTRDLIAQSVAPLVAITASEDAEELCRVNHIPSFADFIKPFGNMIEGKGKSIDRAN